MREALGQGLSHGRIRLDEACARAHAYGVGAIEGLAGEITILDGQVWLARVSGAAGAVTSRWSLGDDGTQATLLAVSYVPRWSTHALSRNLTLQALEPEIHDLGVQCGLNPAAGFAFVVEGTAESIDIHIMNGSCPMAGAGAATGSQPVRVSLHDVPVTCVGIFHEGDPGTLTHHGSRSHVHALVRSREPICGHVDSLTLDPGASLRLPQVD